MTHFDQNHESGVDTVKQGEIVGVGKNLAKTMREIDGGGNQELGTRNGEARQADMVDRQRWEWRKITRQTDLSNTRVRL